MSDQASPLGPNHGPTTGVPQAAATAAGRRILCRIAGVAAVAGILVGAASAAATPVAPKPGAVLTTSHPIFRWTLPANQDADEIDIANNPATTPEGAFFSENVVDFGFFGNGERSRLTWSPTSPLYAGGYWWLVRSDSTAEEFRTFFSTPSAFRIKPVLTLLAPQTQRFRFIRNLSVTVRWRANVRGLTVKAVLLRRGKVVWRRTTSEPSWIGSVRSSFLSWYAPRRIKAGTPLTLGVSIINGG